MESNSAVKTSTYAGLFMIALATLMYEILLTRIFSVTVWYHFAFMAISLAMFGMTIGAILVYSFPSHFTQERAPSQLSLYSLCLAVSMVLCFLAHLCIPILTKEGFSLVVLFGITMVYTILAVPFMFSGICVSLALTKFPSHVSKLYAADLAGAAVGCILLIYTLQITDGPTTVFVIAILACLGAIFFAAGAGQKVLLKTSAWVALALALFVVTNTIMVSQNNSMIRLIWVKGKIESKPIYEKWNSFSRIRVWGNMRKPEISKCWGMSTTSLEKWKIRQLQMDIDASAGTVMTEFDGNLQKIGFLRNDIVNLAHNLRHDAKVLVIGAGGGRDILSALAFEQKSVVGVEFNSNILATANGKYGDFTGHLDKNPKVTIINDEARSYVSRSKDRYDIIQVSLVDTWAATAAGAFVLTENSIYTLEAWKTFLQHLSPNGILTFSRWYYKDRPGEAYRLTSLASSALKAAGVANPRDHIIMLRNMWWDNVKDGPDGIGTILVSMQPFTLSDLQTINTIADSLDFGVVLTPKFAIDSTFATLTSGGDLKSFYSSFPLNITAPTDDSPFFFHMLRIKDVFKSHLWDQGVQRFNVIAIVILAVLLVIVSFLTFLCIVIPLALTSKKIPMKGFWPLLLYFAAIGFGFMLVEVSQMQRLMIFLGQPTYGLSVVLFSLLLSSGLGSYSTEKISNIKDIRMPIISLSLLLAALVVFGLLTPTIINGFNASVTPVRIMAAIAILFPLGFFMGMAFPLGMKLANLKSAAVTPWLWGINGATSVCASVLAITIALTFSISTSFWTGFAFYLVAIFAYVWASRETPLRSAKQ
ncbi:MAG: hypothetical protein NTW14_05260 [bacterium]|nr:hypothetical protein [bacterium]